MPWDALQANGGFSPAVPWLPLAPEHLALAVDAQRSDPDSLLHFYTGLIHWRAKHTVLIHCDMQLLAAHPQVLAYERRMDGQCVLCVFNFSDAGVDWPLPAEFASARELGGSGLTGATLTQTSVALQPWGGFFGLAT